MDLNDLWTFITDHQGAAWMSLALLLLAGEMLLPGVYLLWLGVAALLASSVAFILPDLGFPLHGTVFALSAIVSVYVANRFFYGRDGEPDDNDLNKRGETYVGQIFEVISPIENGRGAIRVGDGRWLAQGPDADIGTRMRVTRVEGTLMIVEPADAG